MDIRTLEIDLLIPDEESLILDNQNQIEKELLLEEIMPEMEKRDEFGVDILLKVLLFMFIAFALAFPKVHFNNGIYRLSREIAKLEKQYKFLQEEHLILQRKLEKQKFKSEVLDTIF
jgi:cell division protein FtsL